MSSFNKTELNLIYMAAMSIVFPELGIAEAFEKKGVEGLRQVLLKLDKILESMDEKGLS